MSTDAFIRTTVTLREDLYQRLKESEGGLSETLNAILAREFQRDHSLFGKSRLQNTKDVRDHRERM